MDTHYDYSANKGSPLLSSEPSENTMDAIRQHMKGMNERLSYVKGKWKQRPLIHKIIIGGVCLGIIVWFYYYIRGKYIKRKVRGTPFLTGIKQKKPYNGAKDTKIIPNDQVKVTDEGVYTYSFWIYVSGFNQGFIGEKTWEWETYRYGDWKHIMHRGTPLIDTNGSPTSNDSNIQFPGFWLTPKLNNFVTVFQNGYQIERLELNDIEMNIWVNFTLVIEHYSISIYRDGKLLKTLVLKQKLVPVKNKDIYITSDKNKNGGFPGYLSFLVYYNKALGPHEVDLLYKYYLSYINRYKKILDNKLWANSNSPGLITNNSNSDEIS